MSAPASRADRYRTERQQASRSAPDPQAQRCAGCGAAGHPPVIVYDEAAAPSVVLTPYFNWHHDRRPALLCASCRAKAAKARKTGRRRS
jgi:hypothetical protein